MKKSVIILFLIASLVITLSACQAAGPASAGTTQATEKPLLTAAEAEAIALNHAGLKAENVRFQRTDFDSDDAVPHYEVEFIIEGWEYEYEINAKTGEVISFEKDAEPIKPTQPAEPAPTDPVAPTESAPTEPAPTEPSAKKLTAEDAKAIALDHAGVKATDARFDRTELDIDDDVPHYEVEFAAGGFEYDYEIHAETGAIVKHEKEVDDDAPRPTAPPATEPVGPAPTEPAPKRITAEDAKAIALNHAGVKAADARFEKAELDLDDGIAHYDIDFNANGYEYDYEINAETGAILSSEKEKDDDAPAAPVTKTITADEAKAIALNHAGLKDASFVKVELDEDDGIAVYEIEFAAGGYEYDYEINAETGAIIEHNKELDD